MVRVWVQRDKNTSEKIKIGPYSDIDDLKQKIFDKVNKGKYQATYKGHVLKPSAKVPQDTTDETPIVFTKIGNGSTPGRSKNFPSITFVELKSKIIIPKGLQE